MAVFVAVTLPLGLMILRYAPGGEGTMATFLAVSVTFPILELFELLKIAH